MWYSYEHVSVPTCTCEWCLRVHAHSPGYGMEAIWKSEYRAHLSTFSEEDTLQGGGAHSLGIVIPRNNDPTYLFIRVRDTTSPSQDWVTQIWFMLSHFFPLYKEAS